MAKLSSGGDASTAFSKAFQPHGFHDACDLLVIDWAEIRIVVEACGDAFSTIKPVFIIEDGLDLAPIRASKHIFNLRFSRVLTYL